MLQDVFGKEGWTDKVSLYVPSTTNVSHALTENAAQEYVSRSLRFLANLFGGATAVSATGAWIASDGTLVTENVTIVYAFSEGFSSEELFAVKQYCETLKRELGQESIAIEISGELIFV